MKLGRQAGLHQVKVHEDPARREARSTIQNFVTKGQSPACRHNRPHGGCTPQPTHGLGN